MNPYDPAPFVSTGRLPDRAAVQALVSEAYERFAVVTAGANSTVYPALTRAPSDRFGISVVAADGTTVSAGDAGVPFTIMSVAKPFVFALVCDRLGAEESRRRIGVNATGRAFNSLDAVESVPDGRTNPMVNAGAIATTSLVAGGSPEERWAGLLDGLSRFAGRTLALDHDVFASASRTNDTNRRLARAVADRGGLACEPDAAVDLYTRQSCVAVTATDLAVMGATLADGGVNPRTRERVVGPHACRATLAVMATAGLYETSGDWLYTVGLPGKSGIGGGMVTAAPGKGGLGTFGPRLDAAGNSVQGQLAAEFLAARLGLDLFVSEVVAG